MPTWIQPCTGVSTTNAVNSLSTAERGTEISQAVTLVSILVSECKPLPQSLRAHQLGHWPSTHITPTIKAVCSRTIRSQRLDCPILTSPSRSRTCLFPSLGGSRPLFPLAVPTPAPEPDRTNTILDERSQDQVILPCAHSKSLAFTPYCSVCSAG